MSRIMKNRIKNKINSYIFNTQWYKDFWGNATKFWYINEFNIDVVNLGSNSGKYAFCYDGLPILGENWALGPQSLQHDFNILKNYFSFIKENGYVFITLCPFSCLESKYTASHNLKYYTFLHPAMVINFDEDERIRALKYKNALFLEKPSYCIKQLLKSCLIKSKKSVKCNYEQHASMFIDMWKKQFGIEDLDAELSKNHLMEQNKRAVLLDDMITFCLERNLVPILVVPPIHNSLAKKMSSQFRKNYIYNFVDKGNKHNVRFFDYIGDTNFYKDEYFVNSFFMSEKGAKVFTKDILHKMELI